MDFETAAAYWENKDRTAVHMERAPLLAEMEKYILAHNTCALATAGGGLVRCTPIEYTYREGRFWMMSEGGLKFAVLAHDSHVCLAIFDAYEGFGKLGGMQVSGTAALIEPWSDEYCAFLRAKKLPEQALRGLGHPMYLLCVTPARIDFLSSAFKAQGFDSRQHLTF